MAPTVSLHEYNTSGTTFTVISNLNLGSTNSANINTELYPVVAGSFSYEKWIKVQFSGSFTSVTDVSLYKSDGSYVTGEELKYGTTDTFATPISTESSVAITSIPISAPSTPNISSDTFSPEDKTDYIVIQGYYSPNSSAGNTNDKTLTLSYTYT